MFNVDPLLEAEEVIEVTDQHGRRGSVTARSSLRLLTVVVLVVFMGVIAVPSAGADVADYTVRVTYQGTQDLHNVEVLLYDNDRACDTLQVSPTDPPSSDAPWTSLDILADPDGSFPERALNIPTGIEFQYAVARGEPSDGQGGGVGYFSTFGCVDDIPERSTGEPVLIDISMTDITPSENTPPVADAGNDQTVEWVEGGVLVNLDGTASIDPDGDQLTYEWEGGFQGGTAATSTPAVIFTSLGDFEVTLTVADEHGSTDTDTTTVSVVDTTPPTPTAALEPIFTTPKWGLFEVIAECEDTCDPNPLTEATLNDSSVYNGQQVVLFRSTSRSKVQNTEYALIITAAEFDLEVTCTDTAGNTSTSTAAPDF
jgi:hypothetical protein